MKISNFISRFKKKDINKSVSSSNEENFYLMDTEIGKQAKEKGNKDILELFEEWDEVGSIPKEIGNYIEQAINNPELTVCLHRTLVDEYENPLESDLVKTICENGLYNQGHLFSSGAYEKYPDPNLTVAPLNTMLNAVIMMKSPYKNSKGGFIVAFPSNLVDKEGDLIADDPSSIYYDVNGITTIKPEFIIGYMSSIDGVCQFYPREQILNHEMGRSR